MAKRVDKTKEESGIISQNQSQTGRSTGMTYNNNIVRPENGGGAYDTGDHPPAEDRALHDAIANNVDSRRDDQLERLPTDTLEDSIPGPNPPPGVSDGPRDR